MVANKVVATVVGVGLRGHIADDVVVQEGHTALGARVCGATVIAKRPIARRS